MRTGVGEQPAAASAADAERLLDIARSEQRTGSLERAWIASREAADIARALRDVDLLAQSAIVVTEPNIVAWRLTPTRQAACLEALAMLGPVADGELATRTALRGRVRNHLDALSAGWAELVRPPTESLDQQTAEAKLGELTAALAKTIRPHRVVDQLTIGSRAVELGRAASADHILAAGRLWRLDALQRLGLRLEFNHELSELGSVVQRLDSPIWQWRIASIRANVALLEHRLDDVPDLAAHAESAGEQAGVADAAFVDLILRAELAKRTGRGLNGIEVEVRRAIADAPLFAQGWRASILLALGRAEEAAALWRTLAPHLDDVPIDAQEWLVINSGHAELAIAAGDTESARKVLAHLLPLGHLHIAAPATTPYGGPVALVLARLAMFLSDPSTARWKHEAIVRADAMGAPWFARRASSLGAVPRGYFDPLSAREAEVAGLVAQAYTNHAIAQGLVLSERTVEQHVSSALRKLALPNRSALATWFVRKQR